MAQAKYVTTTNKSWLFKIVLLGSSRAGKTSLISRFCDNFFTEKYTEEPASVNFKLKVLNIDNTTYRNQVWDKTGANSTKDLELYYKSTHAVILVFDLTNRDSLSTLPDRLAELKKISPDAIVILVGTKKDLVDNKVISTEDVEQFKKEHKITHYREASAKTGENVVSIFELAAIKSKIEQYSYANHLKRQKNRNEENFSFKPDPEGHNFRNKREYLKGKLQDYIQRIDSYAEKNGKINFAVGFWVYPESQAANRRVNYLLAKFLLHKLTNTHESISSIFNNIPSKRDEIIRIQKAYGLTYVERGINSTDLNYIINVANENEKDTLLLNKIT